MISPVAPPGFMGIGGVVVALGASPTETTAGYLPLTGLADGVVVAVFDPCERVLEVGGTDSVPHLGEDLEVVIVYTIALAVLLVQATTVTGDT